MDRLEKALEKARKQREEILRDAKVLDGQANESFATTLAGLTPQNVADAVIPPNAIFVDETQLEQHRILAHHTRNAQADIFRILRTQVLQIMSKSGFRTLAITSPNYGDGKTTIALNLAVSIAMDLKQTVLLADLDLRKPNLHEFLGLNPAAGLSNYLMDNVPIPDCLTRLSFERMSILPAGRPLDNSSEVLGSPKMAALAKELKSRYSDRMVIYDMPPILSQDDLIAFLPHVDAVLMVIREGVTTKNEVKHCLAALADTNVIGIVLNNAGDRGLAKRHKKWRGTFHQIDIYLREKLVHLKTRIKEGQ